MGQINESWPLKYILELKSYLGAPQLDSPVERWGNKQVREVQWPSSCVAVEPRDGAVVSLKHLANACFAVEHTDKYG